MQEEDKDESKINSPSSDSTQAEVKQDNPGNDLGIASLITSLLGISVVSIVLGFIGLSKSKKAGHKNGMALAGIIISFVSLFIQLVFLIIVLSTGYQIFKIGTSDIVTKKPAIEKEISLEAACDTTVFPNIQSIAENDTYKIYANGDLEGTGYFKYAASGSDILLCSGDNILIETITIPDGVTINQGTISSANSDYILIDSGTDVTRSNILIKIDSGEIISFFSQGEIEYWNGYFVYVARDIDVGVNVRPGFHDGYARSVWALQYESGEFRPVIRATNEYDYTIGVFSENSFTYFGRYFTDDTSEASARATSGTYTLDELEAQFN